MEITKEMCLDKESEGILALLRYKWDQIPSKLTSDDALGFTLSFH